MNMALAMMSAMVRKLRVTGKAMRDALGKVDKASDMVGGHSLFLRAPSAGVRCYDVPGKAAQLRLVLMNPAATISLRKSKIHRGVGQAGLQGCSSGTDAQICAYIRTTGHEEQSIQAIAGMQICLAC
jgi:hypothetical protein